VSSRPPCAACHFVQTQLGPRSHCPHHVGRWIAPSPEPEAKYVFTHPTADHPWPFTPLQFARLLILRSRVRDARRSNGLSSI
jgi:hypothetical protein